MPLPAPFQYFGGKSHLRDFILPHIERSGTIYVEPFCGSANIFFGKTPHPVEVLNDLNSHIVNLFRVMQQRRLFRQLAHAVRWTPYAADELARSIAVLQTPITDGVLSLDHAWAYLVKGTLAFGGSEGNTIGNWRRSFEKNAVVSHWRRRLDFLALWRDRLANAQIDHKPALAVIDYWDSPDTVFYLDPPYVLDTRIAGEQYVHEMTDDEHLQLVMALLTLKGRVVLSGYASPYYKILEEHGWLRLDKTILTSMTNTAEAGRQSRVESLWINRTGAEANLWQGQPEGLRTREVDMVEVVVDGERRFQNLADVEVAPDSVTVNLEQGSAVPPTPDDEPVWSGAPPAVVVQPPLFE